MTQLRPMQLWCIAKILQFPIIKHIEASQISHKEAMTQVPLSHNKTH